MNDPVAGLGMPALVLHHTDHHTYRSSHTAFEYLNMLMSFCSRSRAKEAAG